MFHVISPKFNRFIFCTELNDLKVHMEKQICKKQVDMKAKGLWQQNIKSDFSASDKIKVMFLTFSVLGSARERGQLGNI